MRGSRVCPGTGAAPYPVLGWRRRAVRHVRGACALLRKTARGAPRLRGRGTRGGCGNTVRNFDLIFNSGHAARGAARATGLGDVGRVEAARGEDRAVGRHGQRRDDGLLRVGADVRRDLVLDAALRPRIPHADVPVFVGDEEDAARARPLHVGAPLLPPRELRDGRAGADVEEGRGAGAVLPVLLGRALDRAAVAGLAAGHHRVAVGEHRDAVDLALRLKRHHAPPLAEVPHLDRLVDRARAEDLLRFGRGGKADRACVGLVPVHCGDLLSSLGVPQLDLPIAASGEDLCALLDELDAANVAVVPQQIARLVALR
eukprot:scaffold85776_cov63-Phaeocystis_antarctica.AAC.2